MTPPFTPGIHDGPGWRLGRKNPYCIYLQLGAEPSDNDPFVGSLNRPLDAQRAVEAVNLIRAGEMEALRADLAQVTAEREHLDRLNRRLSARIYELTGEHR